ncbi:hypothetical protein [Flavobacterium sp. LB3R33]
MDYVYIPKGYVSGIWFPSGWMCIGCNALVSSIKIKASYLFGNIVGT